jgi:hypothetical protein
MTYVNPHWLEHQRKRWMRPDAERWLRHDDERFFRPGTFDQKYNPDQPRVPAGNSDGGQWTDGGGAGSAGTSDSNQAPLDFVERVVAQIIRICLAGLRSLATDHWGNKTFWVTYDCVGGRSLTRQGNGHRFPGFLVDPVQ